jgi:hypothetical protein
VAEYEVQANCFLRLDADGYSGTDGPPGAKPRVGEQLDFNSMPPELGSVKSATVAPVPIIGRANPLFVYSHSDERAWNLELKFFAVEDNFKNSGDDINESVRRQVLDRLNWCESLVYPVYKNGISRGLPTMLFVFGDMLNVKVICTDVSTSVPGPHYIKAKNLIGYPLFGIANLTLKQIGGRSFSHLDVRHNIHNGGRA